MFELKWVYEFILIIYGLSLVGYFIDFIQDNRKANITAFWLLCMVWVIQTGFLLYEVIIEENFPIITLTDSLFFYSWVLLTLSMVVHKLFKIHFILFFINLFSFFILLLYISTDAQEKFSTSGVQLVDEMLVVHISLAILSYGFFTLSFFCSLMYIGQYQLLKKKKGLKWIWRLGDLKMLDRYALLAVTIGVPLLTIAIILGIVWAYVSSSEFYWFDLKTVGSILVLLVYMLYLILRVGRGYSGKQVAVYNTGAFLVLLVNFFLFSVHSNFHF
ncbi:cytochrome c biogenesis protein CcsA [Oceanobacillus kapialis]|uniref:Cytochrome c biogenesis protein CcsA n=1 Tax=Oceanobacillus kapialis TaxID=481353 RepID=A0ABW5PZD9_9BACI